ncbi:MAG: cyclase family protein [Pseudomonadales bacterium]|nr:cyclase family protein [Pseudomonadales bacterium]
MRVIRVVTLMLLSLTMGSVWAVGEPARMSKADYDEMMQSISNWGRWGTDDELGTLNTITPEKRAAAAKLVTAGVTVSMALELNKVKDDLNQNPFEHTLTTSEFAGHQVAGDAYAVDYHGFAHSHMDGLPHFAHKGKFYNGVPYSAAKPDGAERLGIHNAGVNGVFTRGVLIDMPRYLGKEWMEPGHAITVADLEAWEKASGVTVSAGDVLLIRTGRWAKIAAEGQWNSLEKAAGSHASIARWLKDRDVAVIGCDGVSDVMPSGVEGLVNPLHELVLVALGMPILDNLDLEAVASEAAQRDRTTFLFVGAPLRVKGGTGSPLNPLAVF